MKKEIPAPTAARKAIHETTFGFTRNIRDATGTRNQSAALRYRSSTTRAPRTPSRRSPVRGLCLSLEDREDPFGRLARRRTRRVDLEDERKAGDRLLQDHVDRLRLDILPDFLRRPTPRHKSCAEDGRSAPQDHRDVRFHQMAIVAFEERNLCGDVQRSPQRVDIHFIATPCIVPTHDEYFLAGDLIDIYDRVP